MYVFLYTYDITNINLFGYFIRLKFLALKLILYDYINAQYISSEC